MPFAWTPEHINQLNTLWAQGLTSTEIARQFDLSRSAIMGKVRRLCLVPRRSRQLQLPFPKSKRPKAKRKSKLPPEEPQPEKQEVPLVEVQKEVQQAEVICATSHVTIIELNDQVCRWPLDNGFYCGKPTNDRPPYCLVHCMLAYRS